MDLCSNPPDHFCQNLAIEIKETCVDFPVIVTAIFGAFAVFEGVMGNVKAASKSSWIADCSTGGLLLLSAFLIARCITGVTILGIVVSLLLIGQFVLSFLKKFNVRPKLLVVVLGLTAGTLVFSFFN